MGMNLSEIEMWLREMDAAKLEQLWAAADGTRRKHVGDAVHLRGLIEISSHCVRECGYCGLRAGNRALERYRMADGEIISCARQTSEFGYGTVVLQSGEDYGFSAGRIAGIVRNIKSELGLAVTLSLGERPDEDLIAWREAGADRYLIRFETSDRALYEHIHPPRAPEVVSDRIVMLRRLREIGYEIGSGVMIGIPGQTYASLARDIAMFRELDLDMIGVGPFIPHPGTPLGSMCACAEAAAGEQAPATEEMAYRVIALTRLVCPDANIPGTTALATLNRESGRETALMRGANIVMPNLTPAHYRSKYEIYPDKACIFDTAGECRDCIKMRIASIGRNIGAGPGSRIRTA